MSIEDETVLEQIDDWTDIQLISPTSILDFQATPDCAWELYLDNYSANPLDLHPYK
jgi:hypothetical protein